MLTSLLFATLAGPTIQWGPEVPAPSAKGAVVLRDGRILMPGRVDGPGTRLVCFVSRDDGKTWARSGLITSDSAPATDLGDGNLVADRSGNLLAVYRHNHHGRGVERPDYAVEVSVSTNGGRTWKPHSTVATSRPETSRPSRGLWAPLLFVTDTGEVQCYYDDEDTPFVRGFPGHQWLTMKTYSPAGGKWEHPVTVARAHDPALLSRDGMASVIQLGRNRLLCAFESVQAAPPHAGLIRSVTSEDGGRTWSWSRAERAVLYEPSGRRHHAFSPWLAKLPKGGVFAVFATNEDRSEPGMSGTPARDLSLDVKYATSPDGRNWPWTATLLYGGTHRNYLPGVVSLPGREPRLLVTFLDFDKGCFSRTGLMREGD